MNNQSIRRIETKTLRGYVQALSGLFISKDNPTGLSPREIDILAILLYVMKDQKKITTQIKEDLSSIIERPIQVVTNYIKKFRDKKVLNKENELSPVFLTRNVIIVNNG